MEKMFAIFMTQSFASFFFSLLLHCCFHSDSNSEEGLGGIFHIGTQDACDYMQFQLELSGILGLKEPVFERESIPRKCFQAVLPGRKEIPEKLQMKVTDELEYLGKVQKQCFVAPPN